MFSIVIFGSFSNNEISYHFIDMIIILMTLMMVCSNVLSIFVQIYDSTFDEYIDVEEDGEIVDKAKIKIVQVSYAHTRYS